MHEIKHRTDSVHLDYSSQKRHQFKQNREDLHSARIRSVGGYRCLGRVQKESRLWVVIMGCRIRWDQKVVVGMCNRRLTWGVSSPFLLSDLVSAPIFSLKWKQRLHYFHYVDFFLCHKFMKHSNDNNKEAVRDYVNSEGTNESKEAKTCISSRRGSIKYGFSHIYSVTLTSNNDNNCGLVQFSTH